MFEGEAGATPPTLEPLSGEEEIDAMENVFYRPGHLGGNSDLCIFLGG